jgi:hypothetical protein
MRREAFEEVGPFDEALQTGTPAGETYAERVRDAGYRVAQVEELFVHRFGQSAAERLDRAAEPATPTPADEEVEAAVGSTAAADADDAIDAGFGDGGAG